MLLGIEGFNPSVEMTKAALSGGKLLASRPSSMNSIPRAPHRRPRSDRLDKALSSPSRVRVVE
jgi:hypothetical protein